MINKVKEVLQRYIDNEFIIDEKSKDAIKSVFPQARFENEGAYLGAYDEEYHEVLLERWKSEQKMKISSILNDTTEWYQAKWEDSPYFGWCAVNFFPDDGEEYYGYCKVSKKTSRNASRRGALYRRR